MGRESAELQAAHFEELLQFLEKRLEGRSVQCCDAELGPAEADGWVTDGWVSCVD